MQQKTHSSEHIARAALGIAGVDHTRIETIVHQVSSRLDRVEATKRRNDALRAAHHLVGSIRVLTAALADYESRIWPMRRHHAEPPETDTPLRKAFFMALQAGEDSGRGIPTCERQIHRIVIGK